MQSVKLDSLEYKNGLIRPKRLGLVNNNGELVVMSHGKILALFNTESNDHSTRQPCPGLLVDYPSSTACRVSALGDGTVIEQTVTPSSLCDPGDIKSFLLGIARRSGAIMSSISRAHVYMIRYRVGDGQVSCCYTSGCNKDIGTARGSFESQSIPFRQEAFKKQSLIKVSQGIELRMFCVILIMF